MVPMAPAAWPVLDPNVQGGRPDPQVRADLEDGECLTPPVLILPIDARQDRDPGARGGAQPINLRQLGRRAEPLPLETGRKGRLEPRMPTQREACPGLAAPELRRD